MQRKNLGGGAWVLLALGAAISACFFNNSSQPDGGGGDGAVTDAPSASSVEQIFQTSCAISGCHAGSSPQQGLDLSPGAWYSNLVAVPANEVTQLRVAPGDHASSYLMCKIDPSCTPGSGTNMPAGNPLPQSDIDTIRTWIDSLSADAGPAEAGGDASPGDTTPPTFAGATGATTPAPNSIALAWSAATDNVTAQSGIVYLVYQSSTPGGENYATPSYTTSSGATTFTVGNLATNTKYYFVVRAQDQAGNVDSNTVEVSATTLNVSDTTAPTFGGATSATAQSATSIQLAWTAATDNYTSQSNIVYLVYQAKSSGAESYSSPSYTTAAGATSYAVTGLSSATTYYFVVRAKDQSGNIDTNTKEVSATTTVVHFNTDIWTPIIGPTCATNGCHNLGTIGNYQLNMSTAAKAYANLYQVLSGECTTEYRVKPNDATTGGSYLMAKLTGVGMCGALSSQMPKGGAPLPQAQIDLIGAWINQGAPNN